MSVLNRMMSYDKTKTENQESCNCTENTEIVEYPPLSEEEIEQIIKEMYDYKDKKTKTFIWKALHVHGNKYDYSKVKYIKSENKVEIICRMKNHRGFFQTPHNHLTNHGCPKCAREKLIEQSKMTQGEFIKQANAIHHNKYNYSNVIYINTHTNVEIICNEHGSFWQSPSNHLKGCGCPQCKNEYLRECYKLTLEEFIERSNIIHNWKYDYSKVIYINNNTKVEIICPKEGHGIFLQSPNSHLRGVGCPKCKNNYKGEIAIRNFLTECKIEFKEQKRFKDCKDSNTLPFDFYLPQYNLCIEFDGIQHFKPIKRSYKMTDDEIEKNFKYIQKHDQIKNDYCENNGINLLRIRYDKNVEEKLSEYFQKNKIIKE